MPITTADFNDLVKNAKIQWQKVRDEFPSVRNQLANVVSVDEKTSEHSHISSVETARRRNEGSDAYKGDLKQGYNATFTQQEIALQEDVTKQMRMFDKYEQIMQRMRKLGRGAERRMELDIASLLSNAWSTSYTNLDGETVTTSTPDGKALIDSGHTVSGTSDTFSNEISSTHDPISVDVLEDLEELFNNFLDTADGRVHPVMPDTIITGRHAPTVHQVRRILNSELLAGTANNDTNSFREYNHLIVPFLDLNPATEQRDSNKKQYCFLAALGDMDTKGFRIEMSQDVRMEPPEQVFESSDWQFQTTGLYDFGTLFPTFIAGTKGDGSSV